MKNKYVEWHLYFLEWNGILWNEIESFGIKMNEKECSTGASQKNKECPSFLWKERPFSLSNSTNRRDPKIPNRGLSTHTLPCTAECTEKTLYKCNGFVNIYRIEMGLSWGDNLKLCQMEKMEIWCSNKYHMWYSQNMCFLVWSSVP